MMLTTEYFEEVHCISSKTGRTPVVIITFCSDAVGTNVVYLQEYYGKEHDDFFLI